MSEGMGILESLLAGLRTVSGSFQNTQRGATDYPMADAAMAAFSMFFMQSEPLLGHLSQRLRDHPADVPVSEIRTAG
ncbi:MAG: hypothetical protein ACLGSH_02825 [Acidobacteriota bacterium]